MAVYCFKNECALLLCSWLASLYRCHLTKHLAFTKKRKQTKIFLFKFHTIQVKCGAMCIFLVFISCMRVVALLILSLLFFCKEMFALINKCLWIWRFFLCVLGFSWLKILCESGRYSSLSLVLVISSSWY